MSKERSKRKISVQKIFNLVSLMFLLACVIFYGGRFIKLYIENNKIIIHYFNSDENVSSYEPKVKKIEIDSSGQLTDTFGPGFFDEATNLKYELMKFNANIRKN